MKIFFLVLCFFLVVQNAPAQYKALFDNTHAETAGNADWVIDDNQPVPSPAQSGIGSTTSESYWLGANSAWGVDLVKRGFTVNTLTSTYGITYGNSSNLYDLSKYNLFIVCEPNTRFSDAEKLAIKSFVQNGGGLMMVSDHSGADRNNDGWDSPMIWDDLSTDSLFGIHFQSTNESNNNISEVATNVATGNDPLINGLAGTVTALSYHNGTTMMLKPTLNANAAGHLWQNAATKGSSSQIMFATSKYGRGKVAGVGDSSPADDGSAEPGNSSIYDGWTESGATDNLVFLNACLWLVTPDTVVATFTITASAGANGSISPSGSVSVNSGSSQAFTITPNSGYHIDSVLIDNVYQGAVTGYTFSNVTANHTIRAVFGVTQYQITATTGANGTISPSGTVTVNSGASQQFTFTPSTGYRVDSLIVDGVKQTSASSYTFSNVTANHTIRVTFAVITYAITATAGGNGSISPSGAVTVNYNGSQTFTFTPSTGYHVDSVVVDGVRQTTATSYTFNAVLANHTIRVTFAIGQFTITASAGLNGTISPSGAVSVANGGSQAFTITPNSGYHIDSVLVDNVNQGAVAGYTFSNVAANHAIRAVFAVTQYQITATAGANGSINPAGTVTVNFGGSQTFTVTPSPGYRVDSLIVDGVRQATANSYAFNTVVANHVIRVTFTLDQFTITAAADANGTISPSGPVTVARNGSQTFTITPATGYLVDSLIVDGLLIPSASEYTFSGVAADHWIRVTFTPIMFMVSASAGANGSISPSGDVAVPYDGSRLFTVTASPYYHIESVDIDGMPERDASGQSSFQYTFTNITATHTIQASFSGNLFPLTIVASGGTVTRQPDLAAYPYGSAVQLTPLPSPGYNFSSWSGNVSQGHETDNPLAITIDTSNSITAIFSYKTYALTVFAEHGAVLRNPNLAAFDSGAAVQLTATPAPGYHFSDWGGAATGSANPLTVLMDMPKSITANFLSDSAVIEASAGSNGTISPAGLVPVLLGSSQRFVFLPDSGYRTGNVVVDGIAVPDSLTGYTFENVSSDHTIDVVFGPGVRTLHMHHRIGWNIVSLPVVPANVRVQTLFPSAVSSSFSYEGHYVQSDTLAPGAGYWLKFATGNDTLLTGVPVQADTIPVHAGWNLIGSLYFPVPVSSIASDPVDIITGNIFGYDGEYFTADLLSPAKGYWVKVNRDGMLILTSSGAKVAATAGSK